MGNAKLLVSALGKILVVRIWFVRLVIILPVRLRRTRFRLVRLVSWPWSRLDIRVGSRFRILLLCSFECLQSMLLSSHSLYLRTDNTLIELLLPSMGSFLGPKVLYFLGSLVLVLVLPIPFSGVTGLGILGLLAVLTAFAPFGVLGFLARTLAVVTPLTTSAFTSGLEVTTVVLARGIRLGLGPRTLG